MRGLLLRRDGGGRCHRHLLHEPGVGRAPRPRRPARAARPFRLRGARPRLGRRHARRAPRLCRESGGAGESRERERRRSRSAAQLSTRRLHRDAQSRRRAGGAPPAQVAHAYAAFAVVASPALLLIPGRASTAPPPSTVWDGRAPLASASSLRSISLRSTRARSSRRRDSRRWRAPSTCPPPSVGRCSSSARPPTPSPSPAPRSSSARRWGRRCASCAAARAPSARARGRTGGGGGRGVVFGGGGGVGFSSLREPRATILAPRRRERLM